MLESPLWECGAFLLHNATFDSCCSYFCPLQIDGSQCINAHMDRYTHQHTLSIGYQDCSHKSSLNALDPVCVCVCLILPGVSGLGCRLRPVQRTSSWGEQPRPDLRRNLREIPGAMDTPGGIWCKESVICTSNTLLNQSQAANPGVP